MANQNSQNQQGQNREQLNSTGQKQQGQGNKQFSTDTGKQQGSVQSGQNQKQGIQNPGKV